MGSSWGFRSYPCLRGELADCQKGKKQTKKHRLVCHSQLVACCLDSSETLSQAKNRKFLRAKKAPTSRPQTFLTNKRVECRVKKDSLEKYLNGVFMLFATEYLLWILPFLLSANESVSFLTLEKILQQLSPKTYIKDSIKMFF